MAEIWSSASYAFNGFAMPPLTVALAMLHIGMVTLRREGKNPVSLAFLAMIGALALWLVGDGFCFLSAVPAVALFWGRLADTGVFLLPLVCFRFSLIVLQLAAEHRRSLRGVWIATVPLLVLLHLQEGFLVGVRRYSWGYYPQLGPHSLWLPLLLMLVGCYCLYLYRREAGRWPPGSYRRLRARSFLFAFAILMTGFVDFLPAYGFAVYPTGYLSALGFIIIATRTIRIYRLQGITPSRAADAIVATMQDGLLLLDERGVVRVVNQAVCVMLGVAREKLIDRPLRQYLDILPMLPADSDAVVRREMDFRRGDRVEISLEFTLSRLGATDAEDNAIVCILRDTTERKRMELERGKAQEILEKRVAERGRELALAHARLLHSEKLRAVGMLTASIAHEVGGPVFAVRNTLEGVLKSDCTCADNPDVREMLQAGIEECGRVGKLLRNLRDLQSPSSGGMETADLHRLIEDIFTLCRKRFEHGTIRVDRKFAAGPLPVTVVPDQIKQLLLNLMSNAVEAMPKGGVLTVSTQWRADEIRLSVRDSGSGIAPEDLPRVFEPFFTRKEEQFGSGLGLYICYHIVRRHGGAIEVESDGRGTAVTVSLPALLSP
ncbi:MAG: ATP-binding protein [Thermodesulfobacteriota bacterium]